jgi:hypothetical protein
VHLDTPPPPRHPHTDHHLWAPFEDRVHFETAEFLFTRNQMPAAQIKTLLDLWSATLLKHDEGAPFEDAKELYDTIDSIPLGDVAWETFNMKYNGERPQRGDVPDWMNAKFDVWFRDPRTLVHNLISNPDFDGEFDYAPFHEYDKAGNHRFSDFMSGDWAWKQAVSLLIIILHLPYT